MSTPRSPEQRPEPTAEQAAEDAARRRRLEEVFGDVLPDTTSDERDAGTTGEGAAREQWYRDQVPPHHGDVG